MRRTTRTAAKAIERRGYALELSIGAVILALSTLIVLTSNGMI